MDFFERYKALIITSLLFGLVILTLVNVRLSNTNRELASTLIDLENFELVQPEEEQAQAEESQPAPTSSPSEIRTHQAYNQNQQESESIESRLQEIFDRNAAETEASSEESIQPSSGELALPSHKKEEERQASEGDNSTDRSSGNIWNYDHSSISFSLVGRNAVSIPNPIYTCDRAGKIVVNITVDSQGRVISTAINEASSSSTNECLTSKALQYAAEAVFSRASKVSQIGTITYNFQG